jgi:hypothetical protein
VAIPFDTLDYARKLEVAGVPTAQAELQATALGEALARVVATPVDLDTLEDRLGARIDALDARLGGRIDALSARVEAIRDELLGKIDALRGEVLAKVDTIQNTLRLDLGSRIDRVAASVDTLKWAFGFLAALNIGILIRLLMIR